MGLCLEPNAKCPLDVIKPLLYDSCPGQFSDRVYTVANNSYLTFARKQQDNRFHHPNLHQCNNSRCVEYRHVCDLVDCGDGSEEANCINHLICKNTVNDSKKHRISIEQQ